MKLNYTIENDTLKITLEMGYREESTIEIPLKELQLKDKEVETKSRRRAPKHGDNA